MKTLQLVFFLYSTLPFLAAWISGFVANGSNGWKVLSLVSVIRVLSLVIMSRLLFLGVDSVQLRGILVSGYPLDFILRLDLPRIYFLLIAELCFLLAHWICRIKTFNISTICPLLFLVQGFCSLLVTAENVVAAGGLIILNGIVFFYLIRFSLESDRKLIADKISRTVYLLFFIMGLLMVTWGIMEFGDRDLRFTRGSGSSLGIWVWILMLLLSVPLAPWAKWFSTALECLPEGIALALVTFLCSVILKMATILGSTYPDLDNKVKSAFYIIGMIGAAFSIGELFAAKTRRRILVCFPVFFLALILVSVGVSQSNVVNSVYYICMFVPVFTALILYGSTLRVRSTIHRVFVAGILVLVLGFPGTPVYLVFSTIGARSIDLGVGYTIVFGILWLLYFYANVHAWRQIFLNESSQSITADLSPLEAPNMFTGYCIFLMLFVVLITHVAGGLL